MLRRRNPSQERGPRRVMSGGRPTAFSYHANRLEQQYNLGRLQPREQDVRKREKLVRYWRQRLGVLAVGIIFIICVLYALHLSSSPQVIPLTASSDNVFLRPTSTYQQAATKLFKASLLNGNKITVDTDKIAGQLKAEFPELAQVSITLPLMGHRPIIYIAPATPSLVLHSTASGNYLLDSTGRALVAAAQADAASLQLPIVTDTSGLRIHTGQAALSGSTTSFITTVAQELALKHLAVSSYTLSSQAYELDVQPAGQPYYVKFNMHDNTALEQVGTFLAVQQRLQSQHITPTSYIDVRIVGRAYYK